MNIRDATAAADIAAIRVLFEEYVAWLGVDLAYQGFSQELASLPGYFERPHGRLLLASEADATIACGAFRPLSGSVCEMKRLYVRPNFQRRGIGRTLAGRLISDARDEGYNTMVLDTLPHMTGAIRLYESLGFARRAAYYETPLTETVFFELNL